MAASGLAGLLAMHAYRRAYDQVVPAITKRANETASAPATGMALSVPMVLINIFLWLPALAIVSPPPLRPTSPTHAG